MSNIEEKLIDGKAIAQEVFQNLKSRVEKLSFKPLLCDIVVGSDPVTLSFVKMKQKKALACGMDFLLVDLPEDCSQEELEHKILEVQENSNLCGLIVQLPLPSNIDTVQVLAQINAKVNVDFEKPPTMLAIFKILDSLPINLAEEKILVVGKGVLVGGPVAEELRKRQLNFSILDKDTQNKDELLKNASVIISGAGSANMITGNLISENVVIIDAGTSEAGGQVTGDTDLDSVLPKVKFVTPTPGGVGPVTVAMLLQNVVEVAESLG